MIICRPVMFHQSLARPTHISTDPVTVSRPVTTLAGPPLANIPPFTGIIPKYPDQPVK